MASTGVNTGVYQTRTIQIDTDLSGKELYAVNADGTDESVMNIAADASAVPYILLEGANGATTQTEGVIVTGGRFKVKIAGTVTDGDKLTSDASGTWITTTTDTDNYGAIAERSGVTGDIIPVLVQQGTISAV